MKDKLSAAGCVRLFQPDSLLPAQFFAALKQKARSGGERRLMTAILEDAVDCFQKYLWATESRSRQLRADAEAWLFSDDDRWPFSFVNICEALDIHPSFLRRGLLLWKAQQLARRRASLSRETMVPVNGSGRKSRELQTGALRTASGS